MLFTAMRSMWCGGKQVALLSPYIQRSVLRAGHGVSKAAPVVLPKQVHSSVQCLTSLMHLLT